MNEQIRRIVVVDDDPDIHKFVSAVLKSKDFQIFSAPNSSIGTNASLHFQPDLVILDMQMPGGSGAGVHQAIAKKFDLSQVPVLVFSALSAEEARDLIKQTANTSFLRKPATPEVFRKIVFKLLDYRQNLPDWVEK